MSAISDAQSAAVQDPCCTRFVKHPITEMVIGGAAAVPLILKVTGVLTLASSGIAAIAAVSALALAGIALVIHALYRAFTQKAVKGPEQGRQFEIATQLSSLKKTETSAKTQILSDTSVRERTTDGFFPRANAFYYYWDPLDILLEARDNAVEEERERLNALCDEHFRKYSLSLCEVIKKYPGNLRLIQWLVKEKNADVNEDNFPGALSPLHSAVAKGRGTAEIITFLLDQGANIERQGDEGRTPLFLAIERKNLEVIELLLNRGANVNAATTILRSTPLHWAVCCEQRDVAFKMTELLLNRGANVSASNYQRLTPIDKAVYRKDPEVIKRLILHNALDEGDKAQLLFCAIRMDDSQLVALSLQTKAVNLRMSSYGITPLHLAISWKGNIEIINLLLRGGADVHAETWECRPPLHWAAYYDTNGEAIKSLLNFGANINAQDLQRQTPLHWAVLKKNHRAMEFLLEKNPDINVLNWDEYSPLHEAIYARDLIAIRLLVKAGASLEGIQEKFSSLPEDVCNAISEAREEWETQLAYFLEPGFVSYGKDNKKTETTTRPYAPIIAGYTGNGKDLVPKWSLYESSKDRAQIPFHFPQGCMLPGQGR